MPYIAPEKRERFVTYESTPIPNDPGELNFVLTRIVDRTLGESPGYTEYNAVIGVLACMQSELYRRLIGPYEDEKIAANGDVFCARPYVPRNMGEP